MKKSIFILLVVAFVIVSCSKEEVQHSANKGLNESTAAAFEVDLDDLCVYPGNKCTEGGTLDEVIVNGLKMAINVGPIEIANKFHQPEYIDLVSNLNPVILDNLQSGNYYVKIFIEDSTKLCIYIGQSSELDATNAEHLVRLNKM